MALAFDEDLAQSTEIAGNQQFPEKEDVDVGQLLTKCSKRIGLVEDSMEL